jgi:hypothetical protein
MLTMKAIFRIKFSEWGHQQARKLKMILRLMSIITVYYMQLFQGGEVCLRPVWLPDQGQGFPRQTSEVKKRLR